ncbi:MAG: response regulator transcription factor [Acidobacteriaceae bacterium]|nr:response regulator transcription factor [Acidobacteriaceae bacterium]
MKNKVLLVDDHVAILQGLQEILAVDLPHLEFNTANSRTQALELASKNSWDLAIVDLDLRDGRGGLELIRELKDLDASASVLVYSMYSEEQFGIRAIKAGADGYLSKGDSTEEIVRAVQTILSGERYINPRLARVMADALTQPEAEAPHETLSDREFQILRELASGNSTSKIANSLSLSPKTVSTYRTRVLDKLGLTSTAELIRYALQHHLV